MKKKKLSKTEIKDCLRFRFWKLYIRLRDTDANGYGKCISSWTKLYWTEWQAGHYIPNWSCKCHTWNEDNVHMQSMRDNCILHWNLIWYRDELIKKIWEPKVVALELTKNTLKQWKEWELIEMIKEYREKVIVLTIWKSQKVQKEIHEYVKTKWKKMREILYENKEK